MDAERIAQKLSSWIKEQAVAAGCGGVVLGMSGVLDSSVAAALCHHAFPSDVLGVIMPCGSCDEDKEHALAAADKFSIKTEVVAMDPVFAAFMEVVGCGVETGASGMAEANIRARLRMVTLYCFANRLGYIVAGSGNRDELAIGYFTKYGDGGVDIMPLGGLVKGQVRELAIFLGVPRPIIEKPPSAGFWPGQTDEDEMGLSYDDLDRYLLTGQAKDAVRQKIEAMIAANAHKRALPPVAVFEEE